MIAIAESGSTKCDWVILNSELEEVGRANTVGFNPYFHDETFVCETLSKNIELSHVSQSITQLFFYGAGCSNPNLNQIIHGALSRSFPNAHVTVDHDLVAAAYSLYEGEPVISCIIGTGSNSGFFDGQTVTEFVPALGFILGDEASGSYFGKRVLSDYFYNRLPSEMQRDFADQFNLKWSDTLNKVYNNPHANVYLASFMKFIASHRDNDYVIEMVRDGMARFIDIHVTGFSNFDQYKVGFVGTIAHVFSDVLNEELYKRDCQLGLILKSPVDRLVQYHVEHIDLKAEV